MVGKFSQLLRIDCALGIGVIDANPRILPFFKFGTGDAECLASSGTHRKPTKRRNIMTNIANTFAAAALSIIISASLFAYAIIPASPTLIA